MNPSRPFILRPVATTLFMIAIMLSGMLAFRFLPVAALPEVDYPTIQVQTFYPGASPDVMTSSVTAPLEVQFGQMPNLNQMSSVSSAGSSVITLQFGLSISLDVAEQEVQAAINAAGNLLPSGPAGAADLRQGQSGRRADPHPRSDLEDHAADAGAGLRRHAAGAEDLAAARRRPRQHQRRPAARGAHPGRHPQARGLWPQHRRPPHDARQCQRQHAEGQFRWPDARLYDQRQRPDPQRQRLPLADHRLQERLAGPPQSDVGNVIDGAQNDKLGAWMNETPAIILNIQRQPGANVISVVQGIKDLLPQLQATLPAAIDLNILTDRTVTIRASVPRRRIRADARGDPGRAGDLRVPALDPRHPDPEPVGAAARWSARWGRCICSASA